MKKIFIAITILLVAYNANACSICGCGGGNLYLGMYPNFDSKFLGVRYNYSSYKTVLQNDNTQFSNNTYNTYEIWTGYNLTKKWLIFGFIPYQSNNIVSDDGSSKTNGVGDITLLTNYQLLNSRKVVNDKKLVIHQLWMGGGIKFKTGSFAVDPHDADVTLANVNAQMGTGSTDFILNARDIYQVENWGLATNLNYKMNTQNKEGYQFGNKFTMNSILYYNITKKHTVFTPNAGVQFENNEGNKLDDHLISLTEGIDNGNYRTGGHSVNILGGVEMNVNKITVGVNVQLPIQQNYAEGQTNLNWKGTAHISFSF